MAKESKGEGSSRMVHESWNEARWFIGDLKCHGKDLKRGFEIRVLKNQQNQTIAQMSNKNISQRLCTVNKNKNKE